MKTNPSFSIVVYLIACMCILSGCGPAENSPQTSSEQVHVATNQGASEPEGHTHEDGGDHHRTRIPGPNGGRLVVGVSPHFEFLVLPNNHAQITFVGDDIKPIAPADIQIRLTGGDRSNPIEVTFEKKEDTLVSSAPMPRGNNMAAVLQINGKTMQETVFERFHLNMETCPECDLHEYACICAHAEHGH